jgi:hypothetical protein
MRKILAALLAVGLLAATPAKAQNIDLGGVLGALLNELLNQNGAGLRLPHGSHGYGYGNSDRIDVRNQVLSHDATLRVIHHAMSNPGFVAQGSQGNGVFAAVASGVYRNQVGMLCQNLQFEIRYVEMGQHGWPGRYGQQRHHAYNGYACRDFSGQVNVVLH